MAGHFYPIPFIFVLDELGVRLDDVVGSGSNAEIVFELINWAEEQGRLEKLVRGARRANPGNAKLQEVAVTLRITVEEASSSSSDTTKPDQRDKLSEIKPPVKLVRNDGDIQHRDREDLIKILAKQAAFSRVGPEAFFRNLVLEANLPDEFVMELAGGWTGSAELDARSLVRWSITKGINPKDPKFTTLGSILHPLLQDVGLDIASFIVALIVCYRLYCNEILLEELMVRYQVPLSPAKVGEIISETGPEIDWRGPTDEKELEGFWRPKPALLDVSFLKQGIEQAASVCRIERARHRVGTGFLLTKNLLLTNYHVLAPDDEADLDANIQDITLRFGSYTSDSGTETEGQIFKLDSDHPILRWSPTNKLDYVLLQVEDTILQAREIKPANWKDARRPMKNTGLNILQHPGGETMKVALSSNGITGVYERDGLIQYISETSGGSSGSPCFNDDWQVVALHHAQKARSFGAVGEGILFSAIHQEISEYLS